MNKTAATILVLIVLTNLEAAPGQTINYTTIYPNVNIRKAPRKNADIAKTIEHAFLFSASGYSTHKDTIVIRKKPITSRWVKSQEGWIFEGLVKEVPQIRLLYPGEYHGDELPISVKDTNNWYGFIRRDKTYRIRRMSIQIVSVHDPIVDSGPDKKTGFRVTGDETPAFLIKGIRMDSDRSIDIFKFNAVLSPGNTVSLEYQGNSYAVIPSGVKMGDGYTTSYRLVLQMNKKLMTIDHRETREEMPSLEFAGDIDGDGELDYILDVSDHYNVSHKILYLSKFKQNDFFVVPVAQIIRTGC